MPPTVAVPATAGHPPAGAGIRSPCPLCAGTALLLTVICTYGFCDDPVLWQIVTFSSSAVTVACGVIVIVGVPVTLLVAVIVAVRVVVTVRVCVVVTVPVTVAVVVSSAAESPVLTPNVRSV